MMQTTISATPVPSLISAFVAQGVVFSLGVLLILRHYLPLRQTPAYLVVPVFLALWVPAGIILLVPIDLASSAATDDVAARGIWFPSRLLLVSWRITYWLTFVLTWFILPVLAEYSDAGYREPKQRILYSLRSNARYHMLLYGSGIVGLVYVFLTYGASFMSLKSLVMALAYCWGLTLAIYLMGHGLVAIPRSLIRNADISGRLRTLQTRAPSLHEKMEDSLLNLEEVEAQVSELSRRKRGSAKDWQDWIEELADLCNIPESRPGLTVRETGPTVITEKYLADLTRRLVRARHARSRYVDEWNRLLRRASETQQILDSASSRKLDFGRPSPESSMLERIMVLGPYTRYLLHYHAIPALSILSGSFLAVASACIIWSELVKVALPNWSVIRLTVVHHWTGDKGQVGFAGQVISALWILYMCAAAMSTITEVKVWRGRALVRRNTAHESAFWYSSQVARLSVPLSYNFMTFLSPKIYKRTVFYEFLGQLINFTPLGKWFDYLFPILVLVPILATLFGLYGKAQRLIGLDLDLVEDEEGTETGYGFGSWREGRDLIERELSGTSISRRREDWKNLRADGGAARARPQPILSVPSSGTQDGGGGGGVRTPFATSPNYGDRGSGSAAVAAARSTRSDRAVAVAAVDDDDEPEDDNFLANLGHRFRNTIDTLDTPRWLLDMGDGLKRKPRWMTGHADAERAAAGSSRPTPPAGRGGQDPDARSWLGAGAAGNVRI